MPTPARAPRPRRSARRLGFSLGRVLGVQVRATFSFVVLGVVIYVFAASALTSYLPRRDGGEVGWLSAVIAVVFLASVALHELAHALVARALQLPVQEVLLTMVGGATSLGTEPSTPADQAMVTLAGPATNVLIAAVAGAVALSTRTQTAPLAVAAAVWLANLLLAGYNLVPGLPLDGGQLVRAALWRLTGDRMRALRGTAITGLALAGICFGLAIASLVTGVSLAIVLLSLTVILGLSGSQLLSATGRTLRLTGVSAAQLARPALTVPEQLPLAEALRRAEQQGAGAVLVGDPGAPNAVVTETLLAQIPPARRPWLPVSAAARPLTLGMVLAASLEGEQLLTTLQQTPAAEYLVVDGPRVVGVLRTADLVAASNRRTGPPRPQPARGRV